MSSAGGRGSLARWRNIGPRAFDRGPAHAANRKLRIFGHLDNPASTARRTRLAPCHVFAHRTSRPRSGAPNGGALGQSDLTQPGANVFGANVFSPAVQRQRLPKAVYRELAGDASSQGKLLEPALADAVAAAMKEWAMEHGATHYTHWFQPLTGSTAEKHDSFYVPTGDGNAIAEFSGKELIQGEPDASSFPTGGIRATFEARGYTAWDPTSPAFILENPNGALLCIPTAFASWTGEALDHKIPLLRSMDALSRSAVRALGLLGDDAATRVFTTVGPEQEYFLIDEQYYFERPDLVTTGRTLFGAKPPKGHELDDHYFGSIPERVLACMLETELELSKLGVPIKTRHNEVAPAQYEIAPVFENSNVGSDHQQIVMQVLQKVARRYGLVCLLHEKPFAGVNGSGKHNNWSMGTDTGLEPARAGRDAAREPPVPVLLLGGAQGGRPPPGAAARVGRQRRAGPPPRRQRGAAGDHLDVPRCGAGEGLQRDRERLGRRGDAAGLPRARRLGAAGACRCTAATATAPRRSPSPATSSSSARWAPACRWRLPNTVLNTIVAESIDELSDQVEARTGSGASLEEAILDVVRGTYAEHKRIVFGGDNYSTDWHAEAEQRGLANLEQTPDALPWLIDPATVAVFSRYEVLSERELHARYEVFVEQYTTKINIEGETAAAIARTLLLPAAVKWLGVLDEADDSAGVKRLKAELSGLIDDFVETIFALEAANRDHPEADDVLDEAKYVQSDVLPAMEAVREVADRLEKVVPDDLWPLPKYSEILFIK